MEENASLLFCDTFTHENEQDMQLDLISFQRAVFISEVRVIPYGYKVHPHIVEQLGKTTPSAFTLELFAKNFTKPNSTVFERLGMFDYEKGRSIQLISQSKIATNVVLVCGCYQSLTVCLYGSICPYLQDNVPPPPPTELSRPMQMTIDGHLPHSGAPGLGGSALPIATLQPANNFVSTGGLNPQSPVCVQSPREDCDHHLDDYRRSRRDDDEKERRGRRFDDEQRRGRYDQFEHRNVEGFRRERFDDKRRREDSHRSSNSGQGYQSGSGNLFEPLSPENDFFDSQNEESLKQTGQIVYEDIVSDEDMNLDEFDLADSSLQADYAADDSLITASFVPYQCTLTPVQHVSVTAESDFEQSVNHYKVAQDVREPSEVKQLQDFIVSDIESERDSKWVTMLEELPNIVPVAMSYLRAQSSQKMKEKHFLSIITEWAVFGLNMERACALPLAVNIRFIKAALKLTFLLANCCEEYQRLLVENNVQEKLVSLLTYKHVASSLRLVVIRVLDATTNTACGLEAMFGWNVEHPPGDEPPSIYDCVVGYLLEQSNVRVVATMKPLLQKAHFYEAVAKLQSITSKISKSPPKKFPIDDDETKPDEELKMIVDVMISNKDMSEMLSAISTIANFIENGNSLIKQPGLQSFPTTTRLQDESPGDCFPVIFRLLSSRRFLESILVLVSSPLFCETELYTALRDLLFLLMSTNKGLLFLCSHMSTCNALIKVLLQPMEDEPSHDCASLQQYMTSPVVAEGCMPHHIGLLLVYHLQAMTCVDQLLPTVKSDLDVSAMDSNEHIKMLRMIYAMSLKVVGQHVVASVLTYNDNINCILPFLTGAGDFETKIKKSVSSRYAAIILGMCLQHSTQVEWLFKFKRQLLAIPKKENDKFHEDTHHYIAVLEKVTCNSLPAVTPLLDFIKMEVEDLKLGSGGPQSMLMALKILLAITKGQNSSELQKDSLVKLEKLIVIEMFSSNVMEILISCFRKVNDQLMLPWKRSQPFSSGDCFIMVSIAYTLLELGLILLDHLLSTSFCFKDCRLIIELFTLHKMLCSKPPVGLLAPMISKMQEDIINLLIRFSKGTKDAPESEDGVKLSTLWILLKELFAFLIAKPENFVTGLILLSELLPVPLPLLSLHELESEETSKVIKLRYLAMVNISCLGAELRMVLKTVSGSYCSVMQYYLRKSLCQLVDLGSVVASNIVKTLCEIVHDDINKEIGKPDEHLVDSKQTFLSTSVYNTFTLLSYVVCQPGGKAAFLHLICKTSLEAELSGFSDFISKLVQVHEKELNLAYFENILLPIFQSLCDHVVCLDECDGSMTLQHLANSLPSLENLKLIVELLLSSLSSDKLPLEVLIRSLTILQSLTEHDYGMLVMKDTVLGKGICLNLFLKRLIAEANEKKEVVYNCVSVFFDFLNLLNHNGPDDYVKSDNVKMKKEDDVETPLKRCVVLNANLLKKVFKLDDKNTSEHPMTLLEKLIEEQSKEDSELVSLSEAITTFRMILIAAGGQEYQDNETTSFSLPALDPLLKQFSCRISSLLMNNVTDERANNNDWFDEPAPDDIDSDTEGEGIKVDLLAIAIKYLPAFNFKEEVEKGFVDTAEAKRSKRSKRDAFFRAGQHIEDAKRLRFDVSALVTNPRGNTRAIGSRGGRAYFGGKASYNNRGFVRGSRGFGRGRGGRGRGNDIDSFRLRRQNTSRPPSMHVDDFVNMEKTGNTVMLHNEQETPTSAPNDRFSGNSGPQGRWSSPHSGGGNFRRPNDCGAKSNYNEYGSRTSSYGGRFHNRSNSQWNNSNYSGRDYRNSSARGGGGYWAAPKAKEETRFFSGYRSRGNRHQRTFTR